MLCLTTGVPAAAVEWPWRRAGYARRVWGRRREAAAAAALLGLQPAGFLDIPTRELRACLGPALQALQEAVAECRIDTLWVPAYEGAHQDHDVAHYLASRVRDAAETWEYAAYNFAGGRVRSQTFPDPDGTEIVLELSPAEREIKRAALAVYASERGNLRHVAVEREAFRHYRKADYARPPHGGRLFRERFQWVPFRHPRVDFTPSAAVRRSILEHEARM